MKFKINNKKIIQISNKFLYDNESPYKAIIRILEYILKKDKIYILSNIDYIELSLIEYFKFKYFVHLLKQNYPIEYIIKKREFYNNSFYVNKNVLIPRPETEFLVEEVINIIKKNFINTQKINLIEIGVGSGCIIISLIDEIKKVYNNNSNPEFTFYGTDISRKSLNVAKINESNILKKSIIKWIKTNIFNKRYFEKEKILFDIIISNPPYISKKDYKILDKKVKKYEPKLALYSIDNGDYFYKNIFFKTIDFLKIGGYYVFEVGDDYQGERIANFFKKYNFNYYFIKDYNNIKRVLVLTKNG